MLCSIWVKLGQALIFDFEPVRAWSIHNACPQLISIDQWILMLFHNLHRDMTLLKVSVPHDLLVPRQMVLALSQVLRLQEGVLQVLGWLAMRSLVPVARVSQSRYLYSIVSRNKPFWIFCVIKGAVQTEASRFVHCWFRTLSLVLLS